MAEILIVDDTPPALLLLKLVVERGGHHAHTAESADGAFEILGLGRAGGPVAAVDLILLDIMMPGIDGLEACRRIKADPRLAGIPVIMVSALTDKEYVDQADAAGAIDYITKPVQPVDVLMRVAAALDAARPRSSSRH